MKRALVRGVLVVAIVVFLMNIVCAQGLVSDIYGEDNSFSPGHSMDITNEDDSLYNSTNTSEESEPIAMMSSMRTLALASNSIIIVWPEPGYYYITDDMFLLINTTNPSTCTYSFNSGPEVSMVDNGTEHYKQIYNLVDNMASDEPYFIDFSCDDGSGVVTDYTYFKINTTPLDQYVIRNNIEINWNYIGSGEVWAGEDRGLIDVYSAYYKKGETAAHARVRIFIFANRSSLENYVKEEVVDFYGKNLSVKEDAGRNLYKYYNDGYFTGWSSGNYFILNDVYAYENSTPIQLPLDSFLINAYIAKYPNDLRIGVCGDGKVNVFNMAGQHEFCDNNSQTTSCGINIGECKLGQQLRKCNSNCTWQNWGACNATQPKTEVCYDLKDNDCDGVVDENCERFQILSPNKSVYNTTSIVLILNATFYNFSKIEYSDLPNISKFTLLCTNCNNYSKKITFKEGNHTLIARGTLSNGTKISNQTKFIVDTKDPQISTTKPASLKYTNGSGFYIKYSEDNCKSLILNINGSNIKTSSCRSGKYIEELFFQNISKYNNKTVEYKFIVIDSANNTDESTLRKIKVDTVAPSVKYIKISTAGLYSTFNLTIANEDKYSFDEVDYIDNSALKPAWKPLCTSLLKGNICYKRLSFKTGTHNLTIKVSDNAGNSNSIPITLKI